MVRLPVLQVGWRVLLLGEPAWEEQWEGLAEAVEQDCQEQAGLQRVLVHYLP